MPDIRAIFFDIGDTLVFDDPPLRERAAAAAEAVGLSLDRARLPEAFRDAEGFAVRRYLSGIPWDSPGALRETTDFLWNAMRLPPLSDRQWGEFAPALRAVPFKRYAHPEAAALLAELTRRGFVLGVISDWEETLPEVLAELGLLAYFQTLSISACVGATKPDPHLFQAAQEQVRLPTESCLHIGDWMELDIAGARAAGMQTLLFDWAGRCPDPGCPRVTTFQECTDYLLALPCSVTG